MKQNFRSPFVMVIFGATGDLVRRKLAPALFHLFEKKHLPKHFYIVGFSRRDYDHDDFKIHIRAALQKYDNKHSLAKTLWQRFSSHLYYQRGDFANRQGYEKLIDLLNKFDQERQACVPRFFYLATPPSMYTVILNYLAASKLSEGCGQGSDKWTKVMIEKPFGRSLTDAKKLDKQLEKIFHEEQIYRIDHYLGKETVQNILTFRYGNTLFEPVWNRQFIDHVQISIAETLGMEARGNFYEGVGALRDMVQSHMLQLMATVTMDMPQTFDAVGIREARAEIIEKINAIEPKDVKKWVVRGQYEHKLKTQMSNVKTEEKNSKLIKAYRGEENVDPDSNTETFVALKLELNDKDWQGVPFYLRTGKRLKSKATRIDVIFKEPPLKTQGVRNLTGNVLTFNIQPNEGIQLCLNAKKVGLETDFERKLMKFDYKDGKELANAYERLLLDIVRGDQTLFTHTREVECSWRIVTKIADGWWREGRPDFPNYAPGSWGPEAAIELIKRDGRKWELR